MFKLRAWAKECIKNYTLGSSDEPTKNYIDSIIQAYKQSESRIKQFKKFYNETEELLDKQIEATYNMYKENMELKEQVSAMSKALVLNTSDEKLDKAKEIIKEFVEWANWQGNSKCPSFKSIQDKAEKFLNSEV